MKRFLLLFSVLCVLCSSTWADTHTSNGTGGGVFSAGATWVGGVAPVDTDAFVIAAGDTVTFDMDQSAWAGMAASTINATGKLIASTTAAAYVLKMNANLTVNGTLQAGTSIAVPYPSTCTFTIDLGGSRYIACGSTGIINFYCTHPTNKIIALSAPEAAGQTVLSVDTDVTGDLWAAGDVISIVDKIAVGTTIDQETRTIAGGGIAATEITVTAGLTNAKLTGAYIILGKRNVRIINTTNSAIVSLRSGHVASEIYCDYGFSDTTGVTFDGTAILTSGAGQHFNTSYNNTVSGILSGGTYAFYGGGSNIISGVLAGCGSVQTESSDTISGTVFGVNAASSSSFGIKFTGTVSNCYRADLWGAGTIFSGATIQNCQNAIQSGDGFTVGNTTFSGNNNDMYQILNGKSYNSSFGGTTEFSGYSFDGRAGNCYFESFDHDQVVNAFKAWCRGGIVTSQTASPPTGYTIFYDHEVESATYPCFRQYQTTVLPGTAIEVSAVIRNTDGIDVSSTGPPDLRPRLEIIDMFADPLVDSTQTALDSDPIADADGSDTDWQAVDVIWANSGDAPRQVYVRIICYSHDASTHTIDEAWSLATYQDQIAALYNTLIPLRTKVATANTATTFTLEAGVATNDAYNKMALMVEDLSDSHWELRTIKDWTSGRVVVVDTAYSFTPAVGDLAYLVGGVYGSPADELVVLKGTASGGAINRIGLTGGVATDFWYNGCLVVITGGTGAGQARTILCYYEFGNDAYVTRNWETAPDNTSEFMVYGGDIPAILHAGTASSGTSSTIVISSSASNIDDTYNGNFISITAGVGAGQTRLISDYDSTGAVRTATIEPDWITIPDSTSVYQITPSGHVVATLTEGTIADAVWDEAMADHTGETTFGGEVQQLDPNVTLILADTNELQTDWTNGGRLDLLIDAIKAITDLIPIVITTVSDANDANSFTLTAGKASTDAYMGNWIMVEDATDSNREMRCITYYSSTRVVEVDAPFSFEPDVGDVVWIWTGYLGDLIGMAERDDTTTNVFDLTGGTTSGQGMTIYNQSGDDP